MAQFVAIDFDHTLVDGDKPLPGAREAINILREKGCKIIIHSCNGMDWIKKVLDNHGVRYDYIFGETRSEGKKPVADLYIDDRGYHFKGDWKAELPEILERLGRYKKEDEG